MSNKHMQRGLSLTMAICMVLSLALGGLSLGAFAASATETNTVVFTVNGVYASGTYQYEIKVKEVYADVAGYQSISINYPEELSIVIPSSLDAIWNVVKSPGVATLIAKSGSRSPAQLKQDLEAISFHLVDAVTPTFPPKGSVISISASADKIATYVDANNYLHYYKFIDTETTPKTWHEAYNLAKAERFTDPVTGREMVGYLATVTSQAEQRMIYNSIAIKCGWLGGTRMVHGTTKEKIQDDTVISDAIGHFDFTTSNAPAWYWACGPEAFTTYNTVSKTYTYLPKSDSAATPLVFWKTPTFFSKDNADNAYVPGVYHNFNNPGGTNPALVPPGINVDGATGGGAEPNNSGGGEYVLQFAFTGKDLWNDFPLTPVASVKGFYVEFGGYPDDPKSTDGGTSVGSIAEVTLTMPVSVSHRSTEQDSGAQALITGVGTSRDDSLIGNLHANFTTEPLATFPGYTYAGHLYEGLPADEEKLIANGNALSGVFSLSPQSLVFLYRPNSYTVHFHPNGGTRALPVSKTVLFDRPYGELATALRPGYTFAGWNTLDTGLGTAVTNTSTVSTLGDHTLYAKWTEKNSYLVDFDLNGGTGAAPSLSGVSWTQDHLLPAAAPTRTDYTFVGWNVVVNGSKVNVTNTDTYGSLVNSDADTHITLQAQWLPQAAASYTVIYNMNGADTPQLPNKELSVLTDSVLPSSTPSREGYQFQHWTLENDGAGNSTPGALSGTQFGDLASPGKQFIVLGAQWSLDTTSRTVFYYKNDGSSDSFGSDLTNQTLLSQDLVPAPGGIPSRPGYLFTGWNTRADGMGKSVQAKDTFVSLVAASNQLELPLYAQWAEDVPLYMVHYDISAASTASPAIPSRAIGLQETGLLPGTPPIAPVGYQFIGWDVTQNGGKIGVLGSDSFEALAHDSSLHYITLSARFAPKTGYTVQYDSQLGTAVADRSNVGFTSINLIPANAPTKAGSIFAGWNTAADGSGKTVFETHSYSQLVEGDDTQMTTVLYAQWVSLSDHLVTFDLNGGTGPAPNVSCTSESDPITLPAAEPQRSGYQFLGWKASVNGNATYQSDYVPANAPYDQVAAKRTISSYVPYLTLQAQWEPIQPPTPPYTVTYDVTGGEGVLPNKTSLQWTEKNLIPLAQPTQAGQIFVGWNTRADGGGIAVTNAHSYEVLANGNTGQTSLPLYAQWLPAPNAVTYKVYYDLNVGGMANPNTKVLTSGEAANLLPNARLTPARAMC